MSPTKALLEDDYRGKNYNSFAVVLGLGMPSGNREARAARIGAERKVQGHIGLLDLHKTAMLKVLDFMSLPLVGAEKDQVDHDGVTALLCAAQNGHIEIVHALLEAGADMNKTDSSGATPLMLSAGKGYAGIVHALLEAGADANKNDEHERTPLIAASLGGHVDVVRALLEAGADKNKTEGGHGKTALMLASEGGNLETVQLLVDAGADGAASVRRRTYSTAGLFGFICFGLSIVAVSLFLVYFTSTSMNVTRND
jgi:ankyrin repeat protein